ncbi:MAG: sensor domain-containing diguanylate cyclase [Deltaproteobacteria bacterium]|nr:MAG: sensor domain-containing diguanylate cyclase [Deltaproteobacteria bacterium]
MARTIYLWGAGLLAWAVLALATLPGPFVSLERDGLPLATVLPFLAFGLVARGLSFSLYSGISVSLDSAYYIAAVLCLGVLPAAWLVAITVTVDAAWEVLEARLRGCSAASLARDLGEVVARGAVPAALVVTVGLAFGGDAGLSLRPADEHLRVLWLVPSLAAALIVPHYGLLGLELWLDGERLGVLLRRALAPAFLAEMLLLPLAMVVVLVYDPDDPFLFLLLGVTFVLINLAVKLLADATAALRRRVDELEILAEMGRSISGTLDLAELLPLVARETLKLVGSSSRCMIALSHPETEAVHLMVFDESGRQTHEDAIPAGAGLTGRVMQGRKTLLLGDLQREVEGLSLPEEYNDRRIHSWLGTPLIVQDEVIGMLNVQSTERHAYDDERIRVFETLAAQAAVAIQNARLYELATVDALTGLYVRRYFDLRLHEEWMEVKRYGGDFAVLFLDLDDFKALNDTHGHLVGDEVLRQVGQVIRACMRETDIPCRYGGEEFAAVMPHTDLAAAAAVAERIRREVASRTVPAEVGPVSVTVSIGVAAAGASHAPDARTLVRRADEALYRAKAKGKNRVELAGTMAAPASIDAGTAMG